MHRILPRFLILSLTIGFLSAGFPNQVWARIARLPSKSTISGSAINPGTDISLSKGLSDFQQSPDEQVKTPRPTSTPVPIPPPPDPGSIHIMLFFGVIVVLIILFGVWINRQRADKKEV